MEKNEILVTFEACSHLIMPNLISLKNKQTKKPKKKPNYPANWLCSSAADLSQTPEPWSVHAQLGSEQQDLNSPSNDRASSLVPEDFG